MFDIVLKPMALSALKGMKRYHAKRVLDGIQRHLQHEPERPSKTSIKRLRGKQQATFRLRVEDYRVYYDVEEDTVTVTAILHKSETGMFYEGKDRP